MTTMRTMNRLIQVSRWLAPVVLLAFGAGSPRTVADSPTPPAASQSIWLPPQDAIAHCKSVGGALVAVTSSRAEPASALFAENLRRVVEQASSEFGALFTELTAEHDAAMLKQIRVNRHPTLIIYRFTPQGAELVANQSGLENIRQAVTWLDSQGVIRPRAAAGLEPAPEPLVDAELQQTAHHAYGSPQAHGSPQAPPYPSEQAYRPPSPPVKAPPYQPPAAPPPVHYPPPA